MTRSTALLVLLFAAGSASSAFAEVSSLQSILINANGTQYTNETTTPGVNLGSWNSAFACGPSGTDYCGLGTISFTFNPGPGSYFFNVFMDYQVNQPFDNEYGTVLGAPAAGQSYQIGDSFASSIYTDVQAGGTLSNTNSLPGQTSNYNHNCTAGAACNGDFAAALGFAFTLGAGDSEVITLNVSHTDPGSGLRLQGVNPGDPQNPVTNLFISGSASTVPINVGPVPEPLSLVLLGSIGLILGVVMRRRQSALNS